MLSRRIFLALGTGVIGALAGGPAAAAAQGEPIELLGFVNEIDGFTLVFEEDTYSEEVFTRQNNGGNGANNGNCLNNGNCGNNGNFEPVLWTVRAKTRVTGRGRRRRRVVTTRVFLEELGERTRAAWDDLQVDDYIELRGRIVPGGDGEIIVANKITIILDEGENGNGGNGGNNGELGNEG